MKKMANKQSTMDRPQRRTRHPDQLAAFPGPATKQIKTILLIITKKPLQGTQGQENTMFMVLAVHTGK